MPKLTPEEIATASEFFKLNDTNGDGFITLEEAKAFIAKNGQDWDETCQAEFNKCDKNGDGKVSWEEMLAAFEA